MADAQQEKWNIWSHASHTCDDARRIAGSETDRDTEDQIKTPVSRACAVPREAMREALEEILEGM